MNLLISTIGELRQYVTFSGDIDYSSLKSALRSAQTFLTRYVGWNQLQQLASSNLSDDDKILQELICAPIANLAMLKFVNSGNVRITDLGLMRTKTGDSNDAFEWQVDRITNSLKQQAFDDIETLLGFLAQNLDKYPLYAQSAEYNQERSKLIPSATLFNQFYTINSSRLILETLSSCMLHGEDQIKKLLGNAFTGLFGANLTDAQNELLKASRKALVYVTLARAIREKLVSISEAGVQVLGISQFGTLNFREAASDKQIERSVAYFDQEAANFLTALVELTKPAPDPDAPQRTGQVTGSKIVSF